MNLAESCFLIELIPEALNQDLSLCLSQSPVLQSLSEVSVHSFLLHSGSGLIDCLEFLRPHSTFRMKRMS